jgi:subfamily B ATP-binding cassette protein MsbA
VKYFDVRSTGILVSCCLVDADQVRTLFGTGLLQIVTGVLTTMLGLGAIAWVDWRLAAVVLVVLVGGTVLLGRALKGLESTFVAVNEHQASLATRLTEAFSGIRVVKSTGAERQEALALAKASHRFARTSIDAHGQAARLSTAVVLGAGGLSVSLVLLGGLGVVHGVLTLGDLALCFLMLGLLSSPLLQGAALGAELSRALAALRRIQDVLTRATERAQDRGKLGAPAIDGAVTFERVSYRYGSGRLVLRELSFEAGPGSTTALVGPNGAGKSTLLGLLVGFDQPSDGRVLIDGRPLSMLRLSEYRRHLGVVLQRDHLLDGTIAENIRYGRPRASAAELRLAARLAHCDEFVERMRDGYDTMVGERGARLSGGEVQRVAIARAFLADPRILLLDEAMSHLDCESAALVRDALATLCGGRTVFIIAHRLATVRRADQILVLQGGTLVEQGTHDALMGRRGAYWRAWRGDAVSGWDGERGIGAYAN